MAAKIFLSVGRTYFSSQQPLKAVADLMNETCGTIGVTFEPNSDPKKVFFHLEEP